MSCGLLFPPIISTYSSLQRPLGLPIWRSPYVVRVTDGATGDPNEDATTCGVITDKAEVAETKFECPGIKH